jgi:hypothetical protein
MANQDMVDDWREQLAARVDTFFETRLGPDIVADAKRFAPVDTGHLRDHIDHRVTDHELVVTAHTSYAAAVENGHRVVSHGVDTGHVVDPQPFLRPALYRLRDYS